VCWPAGAGEGAGPGRAKIEGSFGTWSFGGAIGSSADTLARRFSSRLAVMMKTELRRTVSGERMPLASIKICKGLHLVLCMPTQIIVSLISSFDFVALASKVLLKPCFFRLTAFGSPQCLST